MNRALIANLGHPLWGSQSMQELAPGMRNVLPFLIRDERNENGKIASFYSYNSSLPKPSSVYSLQTFCRTIIQNVRCNKARVTETFQGSMYECT